jgi:putative flippase GtrA
MQQKVFDKTFITFLVVGMINTLFGTTIMFVLYNVFGCSYWASSFCDYLFGSILSFFLNKHFTFHYQGYDWKSIVKFTLNIIICYLIAYSLALPLTKLALESMHFSKIVVENIAMLVGTCLFMLINYIGQKFFAFKKSINKQTMPSFRETKTRQF